MKIELEFGAFARPIRAQLRAQRVHLQTHGNREILRCQKDADALTRLRVRGIITERAGDIGRRNILRAVLKVCFVRPQEPRPEEEQKP